MILRRLFLFVSFGKLQLRMLMDRHSWVGIWRLSWFDETGMQRLSGWKKGYEAGEEGLLLIHTAFRMAVVQMRNYA